MTHLNSLNSTLDTGDGCVASEPAGFDLNSNFRDAAWAHFELYGLDWKRSYRETMRLNLNRFLLPAFGRLPVCGIKRRQVMAFRLQLHNHVGLSPDRVNHLIQHLVRIINFARLDADLQPLGHVPTMRVARTKITPFSLAEIDQFLAACPRAYRDYYIIRFFTGLRTGEIDGLKWKYVDIDKAVLEVVETVVDGRKETPKTVESVRVVRLSQNVVEAFRRLKQRARKRATWVFPTRSGKPRCHRNITKRIWYPTLKKAGLKRRRPCETRHTAASLWLSAGENPLWVVQQLGHAGPKQLYRTYARYIPDAARRDGSLIDQLLVEYASTGPQG